MSLRPLMVLGCTSSAGKSLLATALCGWFARQGVDVVPFKAQNMSNNARVVDGGEIGVAQWLQALAAGLEPTVAMNPVLVKPEADTRSQVVVMGRRDETISRIPWDDRHDLLWEPMRSSFDALRERHELVVVEGAGSPAEINLRDQVNNRVVDHADAAALLVSDIDRGGAFAHLYGTWALVPEPTRSRLVGFVLNRFRGDAALLADGPSRLAEMTGMAHAATVPMVGHALPDEEGATVRGVGDPEAPRVAIVRFPFGSNLDEFRLLDSVARVVWTADPAEIATADWVILPGSKHVAADLVWLRDLRLDRAIASAAALGRRVHGVCGGAMMLGRSIDDPHGVERRSGDPWPARLPGLGLLDHDTVLETDKLVRRIDVEVDDLTVTGYEIRHGRVGGESGPPVVVAGTVSATTVHGLLESPALVERWFGRPVVDPLPETFDLLSDLVDQFFDTELLRRAVGL